MSYCSRCGAIIQAHNKGNCPSCGFTARRSALSTRGVTRPTVVTFLAVLDIAFALVLTTLVTLGYAGSRDKPRDLAVAAVLAFMALVALVQFGAGIGLWRLHPYGRALQLLLAAMSVVVFPLGTIFAVLMLAYFQNLGVKALFSPRSFTEMTEKERTLIARVNASRVGLWIMALSAIFAAFVVGSFVAAALRG